MDSKLNIQASKYIKIRLHALSPIHIGCDDVYEPTSFVIDENKKKLIEFDPLEFVKSLNEKQRADFLRVCSGDNLLAIMKFIKNNTSNIKGREVTIVEELISHYKRVLSMSTFDKKAVINQFTMQRTVFNFQTNMPYIPGSSLKGAMRTAYLSALAKEKSITNWKGKADELESKLLDRAEGKEKMSSDPFRMVKVSDLLPIEVTTKIVYAVNRKKKKSDRPTLSERGGVYQIFETIQPGSTFEGVININKPEDSAGIKSPITPNSLLSSLNKFYVPLLQNEIKTLKEIDIPVPLINKINDQYKGKIGKTVFIISIGRHSGAEAVTIEGNRKIKIMQGSGKQPEYLDHATTLWLASDSPRPKNNQRLIPFGWAVLEVVN